MSRVFVHGQGAVSPAGWGLAALRTTLELGRPLPVQSIPRQGWDKPLPARPIPPPSPRPAFLAHARLRRASPMTHYTVSAALEAIGNDLDSITSGAIRLGIVACTMTGGLSYSRRFYQEVLQDPAVASPLVFPETVFNAPASHLSAFLGASTVNYTLVGDTGAFLQGLAVAANWLEDGAADACLVIGAEESDWTAADALRLFDHNAVHTTGAGAIYLKAQPGSGSVVELTAVEQPASVQTDEPLFPDITKILGEGFVASTAWQCVAACDALHRGVHRSATIRVTGPDHQSIGARFMNSL